MQKIQTKTTRLDTQKVKELIETAKEFHNHVNNAFNNCLFYAKKCGEVLIELKQLHTHGNWQRWIRSRFRNVFSYETAACYMKVAKYWNDSRIVQARNQGLNIDSINKFREILNKNNISEPVNFTEMTPEWREIQIQSFAERQIKYVHLKNIRKEFNYLCQEVFSLEEVMILDESFNVKNDFWVRFRRMLQEAIYEKWEYYPRGDSDYGKNPLTEMQENKRVKLLREMLYDWKELFISFFEASRICPESIGWNESKNEFYWIDEEKYLYAKKSIKETP